jgi:ATP-binding cassette, subfamily G (WHITE), member 2
MVMTIAIEYGHVYMLGIVICSIHQPRYSIFKMFDTVLLMCKGRVVYHGSNSGVIPYFNDQENLCEEHENPADFALDVLINASQSEDTLNELYKKYKLSSAMINRLEEQANINDLMKGQHRFQKHNIEKCSFKTEIFYVGQRTLKNAIRNPALLISQIVVAIILGLLVGLVFFGMKPTTDPGVQNRLGAIFFMIVSQTFSTVTALEPLLKERVLFIHVSSRIDEQKTILSLLVGTHQWLLSSVDIFHRQTRM